MKRVVVWSWSKDPSIIPIETLAKEGKIGVVAWFTRRGKKTHRTKNFSYQPKLLLKDLERLTPRRDTQLDLSPETLAVQLSRFQDIYSRVNYSKGQDFFQHQNLFHLYYQYFTTMLKDGQVDAVIYFTSPHVGPDYILYCAAQALGIETVMTLQSPLPNRFFCVRDLDDFGTFETTPDVGEPIELEIPRTYKKDHFYMKKIPDKRGWLPSRFIRDCWWATIGGRQPLNWAGVIQKQIGRIAYTSLYQKNAEVTCDFSKKFIYFPLQLQPELTTSILGGDYSDQLLAIERIASIIPKDWHIYIKENPKQGFQQRNGFFFERLKRLPNSHYLDTKIDTYELLDKCQFVASITGTACWESVSGGKPALIFGNVWFKSLPGIISWRPGLTLEDITETKIDHDELEVAYSAVMSKTIPGIVDVGYQKIHPEYTEEGNGLLLTDFLRKVLLDNNAP